MSRYGREFNGRPMGRYGGEYQQWGGTPQYDRDFGYGSDRRGWFFEPDFSAYGGRQQGYWSGPRYDRGFGDRGQGYGYRERYGQQYGQSRGPSYGQDIFGYRDTRDYPSPWRDSHPGQSYGYGLGFGQGRGQFIYK
ncbi:MAG: hypothetical protein KY464_00305 [Gemmatimonadetes bacterium]|nr:hypothetical protein [Gemmatimonadota bacterium]